MSLSAPAGITNDRCFLEDEKGILILCHHRPSWKRVSRRFLSAGAKCATFMTWATLCCWPPPTGSALSIGSYLTAFPIKEESSLSLAGFGSDCSANPTI